MKIYCSADTEAPTRRAGVAIILNKELTNIKEVKDYTIIPGRAIAVMIPWHLNLTILVLAIYAPNSPGENRNFWRHLMDKWDELNLATPDIILGDFNIVEDALDRLPAHSDDPDAVSKLQGLKSHFGVVDGWRNIYQTTRKYSFAQEATGAHSRINRIYVASHMRDAFTDWEIREPNLHTNHYVVSATLVNQQSPYIGPGRWVLPTFLLVDEKFLKEVHELGLILQSKFEQLDSGQRSEEKNYQTIFADFKKQVKVCGQMRVKEAIPKMEKKLKELRTKAGLMENDESFTTLQELQMSAALIRKEILELERKHYHKAKVSSAAKYGIEGDAINKYWLGISKERKPRDLIHELRHQDPLDPKATEGRIENRSDKMANVMKDFFDGLQKPPLVRVMKNAGPQLKMFWGRFQRILVTGRTWKI